MYCPKCGQENPDDVRVCHACGLVLSNAPVTTGDQIPRTSGLAIAAFVLGILSVFTLGLTIIPAIALGIAGIIVIEKSGGKLTGKIFAILGIVLPVFVFCAMFVMLWPALQRVKKQARTVVCSSNLRQWGLIFKLYTDDHNGYFFSGEDGDSWSWWMDPLRPYYRNNNKLFLCPTAIEPYTEGGLNPFGAWKAGNDIGSYAPNGWICNPQEGKTELRGRGLIENYWRTPSIKGVNNIPIFLDCMWFEGWPRQDDSPPPVEDWLRDRVNENEMKANQNEMSRFCVNRHFGCVNILFMDWSVRRVGLKELWTLKWHRQFDTSGPWTRSGGVQPNDWPQWMRNFKDY